MALKGSTDNHLAEADLSQHFLYSLPVESTKRSYTVTHLEQTESLFIQSLLLSVQTGKALELDHHELEAAREWTGVLFEGTAMGLALLDSITPWNRKRWTDFVSKAGSNHIFASYAALGMALAYLKQPVLEHTANLKQPWSWLVVDGFGFQHGFSNKARGGHRVEPPAALVGSYAERAFYQGLGRSLWFVNKGSITQVVKAIASYPKAHHADLWAGLGIACAYIGGVEAKALRKLGTVAGSFKPALCLGVSFAAMIRNHAANPANHTELACQTLCRLSATQAANIAESALVDLRNSDCDSVYETWRQRIQGYFS
ncbi:MAG: DUF1702 family protein [Candidatus Obscuribacterales bacterium]|nr:DUF1702 family protein [Candidatus Obscuribacterales bacterium]